MALKIKEYIKNAMLLLSNSNDVVPRHSMELKFRITSTKSNCNVPLDQQFKTRKQRKYHLENIC